MITFSLPSSSLCIETALGAAADVAHVALPDATDERRDYAALTRASACSQVGAVILDRDENARTLSLWRRFLKGGEIKFNWYRSPLAPSHTHRRQTPA